MTGLASRGKSMNYSMGDAVPAVGNPLQIEELE